MFMTNISTTSAMLLSKFAFTVLAVFHHVSFASSAKLLSGGTIIAFDQVAEQLEVVRNGSLLIEDGQITAIYDTAPIDIPPGTEVINCTDQIITPGFIDTRKQIPSSLTIYSL